MNQNATQAAEYAGQRLRLRNRRKALGLSVERAAALACVHRNSWYRIEAGQASPNKATRIVIAATLRASDDDALFDREGV